MTPSPALDRSVNTLSLWEALGSQTKGLSDIRVGLFDKPADEARESCIILAYYSAGSCVVLADLAPKKIQR